MHILSLIIKELTAHHFSAYEIPNIPTAHYETREQLFRSPQLMTMTTIASDGKLAVAVDVVFEAGVTDGSGSG